jgi:UDP-glucose 4-epimerase
MKVLMTGGAGFIGSHLSEALIEKGHEVLVLDDLSTGNIGNVKRLVGKKGYQLVVDSILNEQTLDTLMREVDMVYHLAAAVGVKLIVSQPVRTIETNIGGSEVVIKHANKWRKPLILASTSEIYGKNNKVPFKEDDDMVLGPTTKNRWSYACSKAIDEFLALAYYREKALPVICVRFFNTVGPRQIGQYGMVLPTFVQQALSGKPITIYGDGQQSRTFCSIFDVVRALTTIIDYPEAWGQVFNLGSQEEITILNLAKLVKEKTGSKSEIQFLTYDEAYETGFEDMKRRIPDISKIKQYIGFVPQYSVAQIVDQVVDFYRTELPK